MPDQRLEFTLDVLAPDVTKLNAAISSNSDLEGKSLDEIMSTSSGGVFNNAAQVTFVFNFSRLMG